RVGRSREQDCGSPPLFQQFGAGVQHRHPAISRDPPCRDIWVYTQGVLRSRRRADDGGPDPAGEVLTRLRASSRTSSRPEFWKRPERDASAFRRAAFGRWLWRLTVSIRISSRTGGGPLRF